MKSENYLEILEGTILKDGFELSFKDEINLGGGLYLDTKESMLDEMSGRPVVRLGLTGSLVVRPNSIQAASMVLDRAAFIEAGRSVANFVKLTPDVIRFRNDAFIAFSKTLQHDFEMAKLACGFYSLSLEEKIAIPILFAAQVAGITFFYQLGVPDPWRFMEGTGSMRIRGAVDLQLLPSSPGTSLASDERVLWLSRHWHVGQKKASEPVRSGDVGISHAVIVSDHVPFDYRAVTAAERVRDASK